MMNMLNDIIERTWDAIKIGFFPALFVGMVLGMMSARLEWSMDELEKTIEIARSVQRELHADRLHALCSRIPPTYIRIPLTDRLDLAIKWPSIYLSETTENHIVGVWKYEGTTKPGNGNSYSSGGAWTVSFGSKYAPLPASDQLIAASFCIWDTTDRVIALQRSE